MRKYFASSHLVLIIKLFLFPLDRPVLLHGVRRLWDGDHLRQRRLSKVNNNSFFSLSIIYQIAVSFSRVYCTACMKHLLCPTTYEQVLQEDPWECFLCKSRSFTTDTIVRPRANWKDKIINMFRTSCDSNVEHLVAKHNSKKRKIRVLSLFDGLGTGLHIEFTSPISFLLFYLVISSLVYFTLEDRCFQICF